MAWSKLISRTTTWGDSAFENNVYLAFAAWPERSGIGHSAVFAPTRESLPGEHTLTGDAEGLLITEIDTGEQSQDIAVRTKPSLRKRRTDLYDLLQAFEPPVIKRGRSAVRLSRS